MTGLPRWGRAVAAVLLVLALSGCVDVTLRFAVGAKDTISGSAIVAVERSSLLGLGGIDALFGGDDPLGRRPAHGKVEISDYQTSSLAGKEYRYTDVPLADFGAASGLRIRHENRRYVLDGDVDLTGNGIRGATGAVTGSAKASLALGFPGDVLAANGQIKGKSVTWTLKFGESNKVTAEADDGRPPPAAAPPTGDGGGGFPAWLAAVLGAAAVALVILVLWLVRRPRAAAVAVPVAGPDEGPEEGQPPRDTLPLPRLEAPDSLLRDPRWSDRDGR